MNSCTPFPSRRIVTAVIVFAAVVLVSCEQSKRAVPASAQSAASGTPKQVFVIFEGPWAIVDDPKDANSILAIAPKTKIHSDLYVAASNDSSISAGTYDLSVPAHGTAAAGAPDASFAHAKINPTSLQQALDNKGGRYVIRLPKPEAYVAANRFLSRMGASYPPDAGTEQNYVTFVSLLYTVEALDGFSLSGSPDSGSSKPFLLQLESPLIRFAIEPSTPDDLTDLCHTHSRSSFAEVVKFLSLTLYVDFPSDPSSCHSSDPQTAPGRKAGMFEMSPLRRAAAYLRGNLVDAQRSETSPIATMLFLHATDGSCKAPILFLTTTP